MKTMDEFIKELKDADFSVYTSDAKKVPTYIFFVRDNKIGYCQIDYFGWWRFSTVHKPCRDAGTGFCVYEELPEPSIQSASDCLIIAPEWAINHKKYGAGVSNTALTVKKYKSWDEYINTPINQILKYRKL